MKFKPVIFKLKDGRMCKIREIQVNDAADMVEIEKYIKEQESTDENTVEE